MTETHQPQSHKLSPILLIFLIFPIMGLIAALAMALGGNNQTTATLAPPTVIFTPDTLVNSVAPDFTLQGPDGNSVRLSTLRGRWVFLNFWATWCPPCKEEMPTFEQLIDGKVGDPTKATVLAVDSRETADQVNAFLSDLKLSVPVVLDVDGKINNLYRVVQLPTTYVIDPAGIIRDEQIGEMTPQFLEAYLAKQQ